MDSQQDSPRDIDDTLHDTLEVPGPQAYEPTAGRLETGAKTHTGWVRPNNEDQFLVARLRKSMEILHSTAPPPDPADVADREGHVLLVADGIGGRAGGERASALAVEEAQRYLLGAAKWFFRLDDPDEQVRLRLLREGIQRLDQRLLAEADDDPQLAGMGTTLTAASVVGAEVFIVHIGDSRAYLFHDGAVRQLTRDHTLTQNLIDLGILQPDEAKSHKLRSVLTNALGGKHGVDPEIDKVRMADGDRLLLCTDGLTDAVSDERIAALLAGNPDPEAACQALVNAALDAGGLDNITVVVARFVAAATP